MERAPNILLLDVDAEFAIAVREHFAANGFDVTVCADGVEGLEAVNRQRPNVVVIEMLLPGRSGFHVVECLKKQDRSLPVIMVATFGTPIQRHLAEALGVDDFLIKPVSVRRLFECVRRHCSSAAQPPHRQTMRAKTRDVPSGI